MTGVPWARYRVTGRREYRGHAPGTEFVARLASNPERRAIDRGDIVRLETVTPRLPAEYGLPDGWTPNNSRERSES